MAGDRKRRISHTPPHEHAPDSAVLDQIALSIDPAARSAIPGECVNQYAEGLARDAGCSHQEAVEGIRLAFHERYGMTPEEYADPRARRQVQKDQAVARAIQKTKTRQEQNRDRGPGNGRDR